MSYLHCFIATSKSLVCSDGVVGRRWNHHDELDDHIIMQARATARRRSVVVRAEGSSHFTHLMNDSSLLGCSLSDSFSHLK